MTCALLCVRAVVVIGRRASRNPLFSRMRCGIGRVFAGSVLRFSGDGGDRRRRGSKVGWDFIYHNTYGRLNVDGSKS